MQAAGTAWHNDVMFVIYCNEEAFTEALRDFLWSPRVGTIPM